MNGVGLTTVGRLLGHRRRESTAIYAHLDDEALQDAAAQAADVIARAMGYRVAAPAAPEDNHMPVEGHTDMRPIPIDQATDWTAI
jgi:hypothetical protein